MKLELEDWAMEVVGLMDRFYTDLFGECGDKIERHLLGEGWQMNATLESVKPMFPTVRWSADKNPNTRARLVGALVGHSVAHYQALCDADAWDFVCKGFNALMTAFSSEDHPDLEPLSADDNFFTLNRLVFEETLERALGLAARQPRLLQGQFFKAYVNSLCIGSITPDIRPIRESTRTRAYQVIAEFGPLIRLRCDSVHAVHRFLVEMLGKQRAGDFKRTEAICKTLKMKFRAKAGRPSKAS